jgi:hypothetical protein
VHRNKEHQICFGALHLTIYLNTYELQIFRSSAAISISDTTFIDNDNLSLKKHPFQLHLQPFKKSIVS